MTMSSLSLIDRLGGRAGVQRAVIGLYERILDDTELAGYFDDVDMTTLRTHMVDFLIAALTGAAHGYSGRPLDQAHEDLGVTDAAFDRIVFHLSAVLAEVGAERDIVEQVVELLSPLRPMVVR
jgi:hemoglobin